MGFMIDWVSIRQQHVAGSTVGKNVQIWLDPDTGEVLSEGVGYLSHEGSFDTKVSIRAYRGLVEWSGNPSRWGRADNVFGFTNMADCLALINSHLSDLGLPVFTKSAQFLKHRKSYSPGADREGGKPITTGAVLTRVDLTINLAAGDRHAAAAYIRAAKSAVYRGKAAQTYDHSASWGNARNTKVTIYDKAQELSVHTKSSDDVEYRQQLTQWCREIGLVRKEVKLGRQALTAQGLRSLDEWSDERAFKVASERLDMIKIGCTTGLGQAHQAFLNAGYTERQAGTLSGIVSRWYMQNDGDGDLSRTMSRATWYRHRSAILDVLGLDIATAPDVAVLNTQVREVTLAPCYPPAWYRHAA